MRVNLFQDKTNKENEENVVNIERQLNEVKKKIERLEERYILEEVKKEMFEKFQVKFFTEKREIEDRLAKMGKKVSNLDLYINTAFTFSSKLATVWHSSDYSDKQLVQHLVFPEGIYYNRKKDECRTPKTNRTFSYFADVQRVSEENKIGNNHVKLVVPDLVVATGIEPVSKV